MKNFILTEETKEYCGATLHRIMTKRMETESTATNTALLLKLQK